MSFSDEYLREMRNNGLDLIESELVEKQKTQRNTDAYFPLNCIFAVDVSGSMSAANMKSVWTSIQSILPHLRDRDRIGLVTFGSYVKTEFTLQEKRYIKMGEFEDYIVRRNSNQTSSTLLYDAVMQTVDEMVRDYKKCVGSFRPGDAFQRNPENWTYELVVLTDGYDAGSKQRDPKNVGRKLMNSGIANFHSSLIAFRVQPGSKMKDMMGQGGNSVIIQAGNEAEMQLKFTQIQNAMKERRILGVDITCSCGYRPLGQWYFLYVYLKNNSEKTYRNMRIYFNESSYEMESFQNVRELGPTEPDSDGEMFRIKVRVKPSVGIEDITEEYKLSLETMDHPRTIVSEQTFKRAIQSIACPTFTRFIPPPDYVADKYNILVFGRAGSCKTSMINSFYTLLNKDREICQLGNVSKGMNHATKSIQRYEFKRDGAAKMIDDYRFFFTDCWGLDKTNYDDFRFLKLLDGELPGGWKMDQTFQVYQKALENQRVRTIIMDNKEHRKVHAVIYVITYDDIEMIGQHNNQTKKFFNKVHSKVGNPIVVISQGDDNVDGFRENPLLKREDMLNTKKTLSEKLGIPEMNIYFGINYVEEKRTNFRIDRKNFEILHAVLRIAEQRFTKVAKMEPEIGGGEFDFLY